MRFEQISGSRCPYGPINIGELLGRVALGHYDEVATAEEHLKILPGKPIFLDGYRPHQILIHRRGRAVLYCSTDVLQVLDAWPRGPHRIFGLIEALSGDSYRMSMRTVTSCDFGAIGVTDFLDIVRKNPDVCFSLAKILSKLCQFELTAIKSH